MSLDGIFGIAGAIVVLAIVATAVQSQNTSAIITSMGNAFSDSIKAARGN